MRLQCRVSSAVLLLMLAVALVSAPSCSIAEKPTIAEKADSKAAVKAINSFALDLYPKLNNGDENLFFSPYSISAALAMTYAGARGETAAQMARTLHFSEDRERVASGFQTLTKSLTSSAAQSLGRLNVANGLWPQKGLPIIPEFKRLIFNAYDGRLTELNFKEAPEAARKTINKAVEKQTEGKITDLIPSGSINNSTRLVLTNAIYFKAAWASVFDERRTQPRDFTLLDGSKIRVPMMINGGRPYWYAEKDDVQILELPYKKDEFSMIVFLPKEPAGLEKLERSFTMERLENLLGSLQTREVVVLLPRFTVRTHSYRLSQTLCRMGMPDAFGEKADFSGIDGQKDLFLQAVLHKAFINVNEKGTEAAGAAAGVVMRGERRRAVSFIADHPFLYVIRHNPTNCILFMGRLTKP